MSSGYRDLGRRHLRVERTWAPAEDIVALLAETTDSRIRIAEAARTRVLGALGRIERSLDEGDGR